MEDRITPTTFTPGVFTDGVTGGGEVNFFGFSLLVSTYNSTGDLVNVTFFGFHVTALFK